LNEYIIVESNKGKKMKLSLRKANALQNAIQDHIKDIDIKTSISLNEFQEAPTAMLTARAEVLANDVRRSELTRVIYEIRKLVGRANVESGVADLLTDAALIDKRLGHLKGLTECKCSDDMNVVVGKLAKLKEQDTKSRVYGYNDSVETGVLDAQQIEMFKSHMRDLKKEKQQLNDKVLELNVRTEITLDDKTVAMLQKEQLI
jgi:hypothetical protein